MSQSLANATLDKIDGGVQSILSGMTGNITPPMGTLSSSITGGGALVSDLRQGGVVSNIKLQAGSSKLVRGLDGLARAMLLKEILTAPSDNSYELEQLAGDAGFNSGMNSGEVRTFAQNINRTSERYGQDPIDIATTMKLLSQKLGPGAVDSDELNKLVSVIAQLKSAENLSPEATADIVANMRNKHGIKADEMYGELNRASRVAQDKGLEFRQALKWDPFFDQAYKNRGLGIEPLVEPDHLGEKRKENNETFSGRYDSFSSGLKVMLIELGDIIRRRPVNPDDSEKLTPEQAQAFVESISRGDFGANFYSKERLQEQIDTKKAQEERDRDQQNSPEARLKFLDRQSDGGDPGVAMWFAQERKKLLEEIQLKKDNPDLSRVEKPIDLSSPYESVVRFVKELEDILNLNGRHLPEGLRTSLLGATSEALKNKIDSEMRPQALSEPSSTSSKGEAVDKKNISGTIEPLSNSLKASDNIRPDAQPNLSGQYLAGDFRVLLGKVTDEGMWGGSGFDAQQRSSIIPGPVSSYSATPSLSLNNAPEALESISLKAFSPDSVTQGMKIIQPYDSTGAFVLKASGNIRSDAQVNLSGQYLAEDFRILLGKVTDEGLKGGSGFDAKQRLSIIPGPVSSYSATPSLSLNNAPEALESISLKAFSPESVTQGMKIIQPYDNTGASVLKASGNIRSDAQVNLSGQYLAEDFRILLGKVTDEGLKGGSGFDAKQRLSIIPGPIPSYSDLSVSYAATSRNDNDFISTQNSATSSLSLNKPLDALENIRSKAFFPESATQGGKIIQPYGSTGVSALSVSKDTQVFASSKATGRFGVPGAADAPVLLNTAKLPQKTPAQNASARNDTTKGAGAKAAASNMTIHYNPTFNLPESAAGLQALVKQASQMALADFERLLQRSNQGKARQEYGVV